MSEKRAWQLVHRTKQDLAIPFVPLHLTVCPPQRPLFVYLSVSKDSDATRY